MLYYYPLLSITLIVFFLLLDICNKFLFFHWSMDDSCWGKSLSMSTRYPRSTTFRTCWSYRMILFINIVVMPSSSLMVCLMKDIAMIVNHKLILDSGMSFLFARIVYFSSILVCRPWNLLLFCGIYESKKACKILFNFSWSL